MSYDCRWYVPIVGYMPNQARPGCSLNMGLNDNSHQTWVVSSEWYGTRSSRQTNDTAQRASTTTTCPLRSVYDSTTFIIDHVISSVTAIPVEAVWP
jgi:hypothetical protein